MAEDPPPVTIYLSKNKEIPPEYRDDGSGKLIKVTIDEEPPGSNITRYTHKDENNKSFKLKAVLDYQNTSIGVITTGNDVTSVSAYYWTSNLSKVLMVGVTTTGNTTKYYGNRKKDGGIGNEWILLTEHNTSIPQLINNDIERTLDDLVCSNYDAVTIDLSKGISMGSRQPYCCRCYEHSLIDRRITIREEKVASKITYYKHSISSNYPLARIRYYDKGEGTYRTNDSKNRRRIKSNALRFPTSDVRSVSAFYCDHNPVLIYVESTGGDMVTGWYQKGDSRGNDEQWDRLKDEPEKPPDEITTCGSNDLKKLKNVVYCASKVPCPKPPPQQPRTPPGPADGGDEASDSKAGAKVAPILGAILGKLFGGALSGAFKATKDEKLLGSLITLGDVGYDFSRKAGKDTIGAALEIAEKVLPPGPPTASENSPTSASITEPTLPEPPGQLPTAETSSDSELAKEGEHQAFASESPGEAEALAGLVSVPAATGFTVLTGLGSTSGTLAGAAGTGATFSGGRNLYNRSKGDPWILSSWSQFSMVKEAFEGQYMQNIGLMKFPYEILLIDDNSPDGTLDVYRKLQKLFPNVQLKELQRKGKLGLGSAYIDGLKYTKYDFILIMDADLSHHPKYILDMINVQKISKCDIVSGTRYAPGGGASGWDLKRVFISKCANFLAQFLLRPKFSDLTGSFRLYRRTILESVIKDVKGKGEFIYST
ncbi:hypothetical protein BEWA_026210 [Theileria equi strain WA]|uniref:dolichyl-phosphate beta-D-mannosyltransferase n=1 Tax=Theileria equi strain WA TaxID=1537102 RepID=L0AVZ2_THEEQ|nr:hypothetical protein BEWA_026210 [Theileria equi strain WA]AFZ79772.1 hypothetical protein BEWA_026210 [Theileria equi strain WA]|eukprot:XP_004829438.1 hypothetical protein BEWA_026210 [Theileria equi strain WA]